MICVHSHFFNCSRTLTKKNLIINRCEWTSKDCQKQDKRNKNINVLDVKRWHTFVQGNFYFTKRKTVRKVSALQAWHLCSTCACEQHIACNQKINYNSTIIFLCSLNINSMSLTLIERRNVRNPKYNLWSDRKKIGQSIDDRPTAFTVRNDYTW